MTLRRRMLVLALAGSSFLPCTVPAHDLSLRECQEGRDFIRNAALSRDDGLDREAFIVRFDEDVELIQKYPPDLRWFVQDESDRLLLRAAAEQVFDAPEDPERHAERFLESCYSTIARLTPR